MKYLIGHPSWCTNSNSYWHSDAILRQWSWSTLFQIITWRMTASDLMPIYCQLWPWEQILMKYECRYEYFSLKENALLMLSLEVRPFCSGPGDVKAGKHSWQAIKIHDIFWPGCPLRSAAAHFRMLSKVVCHESPTAQLGKPNKPLKVKVWSWNCHSKNWWPTPTMWNIHSDVIMTTRASQFTSLTVVYNRLFRRKSKKTSKLRVTGLCVGNSPGSVDSPHNGPFTRKMFPFDDVIMVQECPSVDAVYRTLADTIILHIKSDSSSIILISRFGPFEYRHLRFVCAEQRKKSKHRVTGVCEGNHWWPVHSPHNGSVTRKMFPCDYVIISLQNTQHIVV